MQDLISRNSSRLEFSMRLLDVVVLNIAGQLAGLIHFNTSLVNAEPIHTVLLYFCSGLVFFLFPQFDVYASWRGRSMPEMVLQLAASWGLVLLIAVIFSFLIHHVGALSRLWVFYWFLVGLIFLVFSRAAAYSTLTYLRKKGLNSKRVVIVGYGSIGREMHRRALQQDWYGYEVKAVHADDLDRRAE